jgi:hypothetical protein
MPSIYLYIIVGSSFEPDSVYFFVDGHRIFFDRSSRKNSTAFGRDGDGCLQGMCAQNAAN